MYVYLGSLMPAFSRILVLLGLSLWTAVSFGLPTTPTAAPAPTAAAPGEALGTLLVYPIFDIRQFSSTQIRVSNYGYSDVRFHYNYVCPGVPHVNDFCAKLNKTVSLTPHETRVIDVSAEHPPCNQGFVLGFASNSSGEPISYNFLAGSYAITSGRRVDQDNAVAIKSVREKGAVLGSSQGFNFVNGEQQDFDPLAPLLVSDFRATEVESEGTAGTKLVLLDLGAALGLQNPASTVFINFWSSSEQAYSSSLEFICWAQLKLEDINDNFRAENLGTRYGSFQAESVLSCPGAGMCPPLNPRAALLLGVIQEYGPDDGAMRSPNYIPCEDGSFDPSRGCVPNPTPTPTSTNTNTPTPSATFTNTSTPTPSNTFTPTSTSTPTFTPTNTATTTPFSAG